MSGHLATITCNTLSWYTGETFLNYQFCICKFDWLRGGEREPPFECAHSDGGFSALGADSKSYGKRVGGMPPTSPSTDSHIFRPPRRAGLHVLLLCPIPGEQFMKPPLRHIGDAGQQARRVDQRRSALRSGPGCTWRRCALHPGRSPQRAKLSNQTSRRAVQHALGGVIH
jgi:hypothetical protein